MPGGVGGARASLASTRLEAALEARALGVHASTPMVRQLAVKLIRELGLDTQAQTLLDLAVRVRDIGTPARHRADGVLPASTHGPSLPVDLVLQVLERILHLVEG